MLIPIDRPLIDGRNTREALLQSVTEGFVATHNQKRVLRLQPGSPDSVSTAPHIQAGVRIGQVLTIFCINDSAPIVIQDGGGVGTQLNGDWSVGSFGDGSFLHVMWDGFRWWEIGRGVGEASMSGLHAHAEGNRCIASGNSAHAEGYETTASDRDAHSEGIQTTASQADAHAQGNNTTASGFRAHSQGLQTTASGSNATSTGDSSLADLYNMFAHGVNKFAAQGDAQFVRYVGAKLVTMSNSWQEILFLDNNDDYLVIPASTLLAFEALVAGIDDVSGGAGQKSIYKLQGGIWRDNAGNTSILSPATTEIHEDDASYDCRAVANDSENALQIEVQEADADTTTVRWTVVVWGMRVSFP